MSKDIQTEQEQATRSETKRVGLFARQPLSTLGKVAFWAFLLQTIAGIGGAIAIAITSGGSRDIEIFAALSLAATILIVTGIRWVQAIGSLVGIYLLYLQFVQPFIMESLTNPKGDPHGGFGHFIGNVFTISINILACVASIGAVVQDYRRGSRKAPGWFTSALGGCIGLAIGALFIGALASPASSTAHATLTYTNGVPTVHLSPGSFDLQSVTITKGSKLLLVDDTTEQHVLANGTWQQNTPMQKQEPGAPSVKNLSLSGTSVIIGPFTTAGTYHILCLIHRGMQLTIIVQ